MAEITLDVPKLKPRQKDIFKAWLNPDNKYITVSCGRQVGKTQTACTIALYTALFGMPDNPNPSVTIGIFLPTYKQTVILFKRIDSWVGNKIKGLRKNISTKEFFFPNGSIIRFHTADNDNMRGFTYDYVIVDEACSVKSEIWEAGIEPTVSVAQSQGYGKVLLTSTPKEKNWFYNHFMDVTPGYQSIKFTSYEAGIHSKALIDDKRRKMNPSLFRNEYLAEFQEGSAGMFDLTRADFINTESIIDKKAVVAAIDWGGRNDFTVLSMINKNKEVFAVHSFIHTDYSVVYTKITELLRAAGSPVCWSEKNGVGEHATSALKKLYPRVKEWNTSNKSKTEMALKLSEDILTDKKAEKIKLPDDAELKLQFENFAYVYEYGKFKFVSMKSEIHDDIVMSIAIANMNFKIYKSVLI